MKQNPINSNHPSFLTTNSSLSTDHQIVITVKNLTKVYKLYDRNFNRLKEFIHPLRKKYHRRFSALKNVSFNVRKGEVLGIIGENGAGKTSLLNIITGVVTPSSGQVTTRGKVSALLGLGTSFNPELTGIENIYFNATIQGYQKEEMDEKLDMILSFADIGDFIYQPIKTYSSGMNARLGFAVAINIDPEILIVDEILAVGDVLFKRKCYSKIRQFMEEGKTILFVSHSVPTINELCTRVLLMDQGELLLESFPNLVTKYYQKLLYATDFNQIKIRKEIIQLNKDDEKKRDFVKKISNGDLGKEFNEEIFDRSEKEELEFEQKAFFVPDFTPKSTVEYENHGIDIDDIHIRTLDDLKVNALVMNEDYIFSYNVSFNIDAENVLFGVRFKTKKGLNISGLNSLKDKKLVKEVQKGEKYLIEFNFKCILLPGTYFIDTGIGSFYDNDIVYLKRVVDCMVFEVQNIADIKYSGIVHLDQKLNIKKIDND